MAVQNSKLYAEKCKSYNDSIQKMLKMESEVLREARTDLNNATEKLFNLSGGMLDLASRYFALNSLSLVILNKVNDDALGEARKTLFKAIIYLENIVSNKLDASYSEYDKQTKELAAVVSSAQRLEMVKKMGIALGLLQNYAYDNKSKWKWSFVELEGRFAAVAKNMLELSSIMQDTEPNSPVYEETKRHLNFAKQLLTDTSAHYRDKFNLFSNDTSDLIFAQRHLCALRLLHIALGEREEAEAAKKQIDSFQARLDESKAKKAIG